MNALQKIKTPIVVDDEGTPIIKNDKFKLFADNLLRLGNQTQAAIETGYSARTAGVTGAKLAKRPEIAEYLAYMRAKSTEETLYDVTKWKKELIGLAHSNVQDFTRLNADGDLEVDFTNATREQLAAVSSVKVKKRTIYNGRGDVVGEEHQSEFKLWDKLRAAELLGKHEGYLKDTETKVVIDVADRLLTARRRVMDAMRAEGEGGAVIEG